MKKITKIVSALIIAAAFSGLTSCNQKKSNKAETFKGKNVRVVIGSTSTSGDSYLIAQTASRYLAEELGANMKVDAVGAASALDLMQTSKPDGNTIMIFHDMTYLGVSFGAYDEMYKLENMTVGPRLVQNPGAAWAAKSDAPYETLSEIPEYLKETPGAVVRMACEAGGVSHVGFISFYEWVKTNYGDDIASRIVVIVGGSTAEKCQMLWDGNTDVIFADYTSLLDYTKTDDTKISMKFVGLLDNIEGVGVPSYADMGITLKGGKEFRFSKDFAVYLPKDFPADLLAELDAAAKKVCENPKFAEDLAKMKYRPAYMEAASSKDFFYGKRADMQGLIDAAPELDELVQK